MLSRIGGAVLLAVGLALAVGLLGGVVAGVAGVVKLTLKVLIVSGVFYWGWRCWLGGPREASGSLSRGW